LSASAERQGGPGGPDLSSEDWQIIDTVGQFLTDALHLKRWWQQADAAQSYAETFALERTFNRPDRSYGFFDAVPLSRGLVPVMGSVQEMFYDQPRAPASLNRPSAEWIRDQIREFVLRYFMRVSSFRRPEAAIDPGRPLPPAAGRFSWCPDRSIHQQGFGFSQLYYKRRDGAIGRFPADEESAIVDMRELRTRFEWIVAKVRIFDFDFRFRPFGERGPEVVFALDEESYLVLSADLITLDESPPNGELGRYGVGYAFIRTPGSGVIAYGPGQFQAAFELIRFNVDGSGRVTVSMVFVVNRPDRVANLELRPLEWGFGLADTFTFGASSTVLWPFQRLAASLPFRCGPFDPIYLYISLANALTRGAAARELCVSRDQLDKRFLMKHFMEHYATVVGSNLTWRQIPDWLDEKALPNWVVTGRSS
jgi:hypothetical protein